MNKEKTALSILKQLAAAYPTTIGRDKDVQSILNNEPKKRQIGG